MRVSGSSDFWAQREEISSYCANRATRLGHGRVELRRRDRIDGRVVVSYVLPQIRIGLEKGHDCRQKTDDERWLMVFRVWITMVTVVLGESLEYGR